MGTTLNHKDDTHGPTCLPVPNRQLLSSQSSLSSNDESTSITPYDDSKLECRGSPYLSTMLCRRQRSRQPAMQVCRGSLFEILRQRGVPEDIASRRQYIYNRLCEVVRLDFSNNDNDNDDDDDNYDVDGP